MATVTGINSCFTYIVTPLGEVLFRKFPCFCPKCFNMEFENCEHKSTVGKVRVVVKAGQNIRKNV